MTTAPALELHQLGRRFGQRELFSGLDFVLPRGRLVAIMGESGVGKSTLLNCIAGLDIPDHGEIRVNGERFDARDEARSTTLRGRHVGFVFQAFHILPHLSVLQNVTVPLALNGVRDAAQARRQALAQLERVGMADRADDAPQVLSGGQLQRVAIARALVHEPALILADEPTGNLDPETAAQVLDVLVTEVRQRGAAGLIVTHSVHAAARADVCLVLGRNGLRPAT